MQIQTPNTASENTLRVENPANGELLGTCAIARSREIDLSVSIANETQRNWGVDVDFRREALRQCAKALTRRTNSTQLATLLTQEQGKPFRDALKEVFAAAHWFSMTADLDLTPETVSHKSALIEVHRRPLGVVAAITPWNYPLLLAASKAAPALLAGNAVVLKPSPYTPLSTRAMLQLLTHSTKPDGQPALPAGVLQVLVGDDETGRLLVQHPGVNKVSFTGSIESGKEIAAVAAGDLKRLTLELGGNDAAIVLSGFDIHQMAEGLFWGAFTNAGQFCVGIKRLYVARSIFDAVVDRLTDIAAGMNVGIGSEPGVQMGPLANQMQYRRIIDLVDDAKRHGGAVCCGGKPLDGPGYFYPPTIVTNVGTGVRLVDEEQFGPALPVMPFDNVDEAIAHANQTEYGLGGSIWSSDVEQAAVLASQMECGTCWINHHGELSPQTPFGGWKSSGIGCENGTWGLGELTRLQVINRLRS